MARKPLEVEALRHEADRRRNIPTAEMQPLMQPDDLAPRQLRYPRNPDLDPQLVWRGKDEQDWSDLVVQAPPLYIQEKVHPKAIVADLMRRSAERRQAADGDGQPDLFADFNGLHDPEAKCESCAVEQNRPNRLDDGGPEPLNPIVEIEGYRGGDARDKANAVRHDSVPGVNNLGRCGRRAFAAFADAFGIEAESGRLLDACDGRASGA